MKVIARLKLYSSLLLNLIGSTVFPLFAYLLGVQILAWPAAEYWVVGLLMILAPVGYLSAVKIVGLLKLSQLRLLVLYACFALVANVLLAPVYVWLIVAGHLPLLFPVAATAVFFVGLIALRVLVCLYAYGPLLVNLLAAALTPVLIFFWDRTAVDVGQNAVDVIGAMSVLYVVAYVLSMKIVSRLGLSGARTLLLYLYYVLSLHLLLLPLAVYLVLDGTLSVSFIVSSVIVLYASLVIFRYTLLLLLKFRSGRVDPSLVERATYLPSGLGCNQGRVAWIVSFTGVSNEPRVLRQARALTDSGWRVVVLGYDGHSERPKEWGFVRLPASAPYASSTFKLLKVMQAVGMLILLYLPKFKVSGARMYHRGISNWRYIRTESLRILKENPEIKPDLVISHDFFTCDTGYSLAEKSGAKFSVDCHEYSTGQYMDSKKWVKFQRPYVVAMQDYFLSRAQVVTTVCDGIANLLNQEHRLQRDVVVVRSVPFKRVQEFKPAGEKITVLYHGDVSYARGLQKAIQSMPLWRSEFHLLIRGAGDEKHVSFLRELAVDLGVSERLVIEGPVSFDDIIPRANEADIGYFVHRDISPQKRFTLPNKFFEYIMAGVALCVSDLPEMAAIVNRHKCGLLVSDYDENVIAHVINSFDHDSINRFKKASIEAAEELNWNSEGRRMVEAYENVFIGAGAVGRSPALQQ